MNAHVCTCGDCAVAPYDDRCKHQLRLDDVERQRDAAREAVRCLTSVVKSGEEWSDTLQAMYDRVMNLGSDDKAREDA